MTNLRRTDDWIGLKVCLPVEKIRAMRNDHLVPYDIRVLLEKDYIFLDALIDYPNCYDQVLRRDVRVHELKQNLLSIFALQYTLCSC
jgi:hypothetical protein